MLLFLIKLLCFYNSLFSLITAIAVSLQNNYNYLNIFYTLNDFGIMTTDKTEYKTNFSLKTDRIYNSTPRHNFPYLRTSVYSIGSDKREWGYVGTLYYKVYVCSPRKLFSLLSELLLAHLESWNGKATYYARVVSWSCKQTHSTSSKLTKGTYSRAWHKI